MALTVNNGDNETHIGSSSSLDYTLYNEEIKEISVNNQNKEPIQIWIAKEATNISHLSSFEYISVNETQSLIDGFLMRSLNLSGLNVSLTTQIRLADQNSSNSNKGYLILLKLGENPQFKQNKFDFLHILCPTDLKTEIDNGQIYFYEFFLNMRQVNGFKGKVGLALLELTDMSNIDCRNKVRKCVFLLLLLKSSPLIIYN